jgi:hypothetical protein
MQIVGGNGWNEKIAAASKEECLYLNVWTSEWPKLDQNAKPYLEFAADGPVVRKGLRVPFYSLFSEKVQQDESKALGQISSGRRRGDLKKTLSGSRRFRLGFVSYSSIDAPAPDYRNGLDAGRSGLAGLHQ